MSSASLSRPLILSVTQRHWLSLTATSVSASKSLLTITSHTSLMYYCRRKRASSQILHITMRLFAILSVEAIRRTTLSCITTLRIKYEAWSDVRMPSLEYRQINSRQQLKTKSKSSAKIYWSKRKAQAKTSSYPLIKSKSVSSNSKAMAKINWCSTSSSLSLSLNLTSMVWLSMLSPSISASIKGTSKRKNPNHHSFSLLTMRKCWRKKLSGNRFPRIACLS